jgi:hypothetical protein
MVAIEFYILRDTMLTLNIVPEIGDIINWDDMTFIGGSREMTILYDLETIKTILRYNTIEERVLHILGQLDDTPIDNFDINNITTATVTSVLGIQNIISNEFDVITKKLPYDLIFRNNIVFLDFYSTSANNALLECIYNNTPVIGSMWCFFAAFGPVFYYLIYILTKTKVV